ncbi:MAG TPA: DUF2339 domain-containing protein [Novosphingobium sp.]|nr:DUF2339 domain-containing protein [Novosphingobium sp.]
MEFILTLGIVIGAVLLFDARGRLKRVEQRLALAEAGLRQRIAAGTPAQAMEGAPLAPSFSEGVGGGAAPAAELRGASDALASPPPLPPSPEEEGENATSSPLPPAGAAGGGHVSHSEPPIPPAPPSPRVSINFEELFGRKLPIWAGGITLAIAGVLIVKYAIDIGLFGRVFTPGVQAVCGLLFGLGLIGGAEWAHVRRDRVDDPRVAQALSGAGISTLYAALLVAANAYGLISPLTAFVGLAVVTAMALALSLRHGAPSALLGLAGGLAAPALTLGITANVPLLAVYMAFTVAGLVGVARTQRWPWLALLALVGGAGWSLWLILAGQALTVLGSLSVGMFVVLIAVAAPLFAFEGARGPLLRGVAAVVGAAQLALLVATGGFAPLDWALFALIAGAGQWLAWRDEKLAVVPTLGAALSVLLLLIWPDPANGRLLPVGLALAAIHAGPLMARMWTSPVRVQRAIELSAIAVAAPVVALRHLWGYDTTVALAALGGAAVILAAAATGWTRERQGDSRFAWLIATGAGLLMTSAWFAVPHWQTPLFSAAIVAAIVALAKPAGDRRLEAAAAGFGLFVVMQLTSTVRDFAELDALTRGAAVVDGLSVLRWAAITVMAAFMAWRAERPLVRDGSGALAAGLAYGTLAQVLPLTALPLVAPPGVLALVLAGKGADWPRLRAPVTALVAIVIAWAFVPLAVWSAQAALSLGGAPMRLADDDLVAGAVARRLLAPALLVGAALWLSRERLPRAAMLAGTVLAGVLGLVSVHCFYRIGFASAFGADFVATGLAQRLVWDALLIGAGLALWRRARGLPGAVVVGLGALHVAWYSLLLHDPLWSAQHVGPVPLANLLLPLFAALPLCLWLLGSMRPALARFTGKTLQPVVMVMAALLAWATLRQAFHGTLLVEPGLGGSEDILRSILGIALAVGYLLWGIARHRRDWRIASLFLMLAAVVKVFLFDASGLEGLLRIASFVALGFSLIGLGWLYSRQLRGEISGTELPTSSLRA